MNQAILNLLQKKIGMPADAGMQGLPSAAEGIDNPGTNQEMQAASMGIEEEQGTPVPMPPEYAQELQVASPEMQLMQEREKVKQNLKSYRMKELDQEMQEVMRKRMQDIENEQVDFGKET